MRRLPRIALATVVMAVAIFGACEALAPLTLANGTLARLALLALLVAIGLGIYLASLETLGVARLRDLLAGMRASAPPGNRQTSSPDH
jgi:peptidoglycan biosynthesis protein MviN/MurJ (putative lipid II flippase)